MNDPLNSVWFWLLVGLAILGAGIALFHWIFERHPQEQDSTWL